MTLSFADGQYATMMRANQLEIHTCTVCSTLSSPTARTCCGMYMYMHIDVCTYTLCDVPTQNFGEYQGAHSEGVYLVKTSEGEALVQLLEGYIELILRTVSGCWCMYV